MKPKHIQQILQKFLEARLPVLLVGQPGVGKTSIVAAAAEAAGYELIVSHPAVADPTDFKGLPWPSREEGRADFLPFGEFDRALKAERPTVWFMDDLGQAPPSVQAACMQLLLARRVNGHVLPDGVMFVAATNRRQDRAGVNGMLTPVLSRFAAVIEVEPDLDDWCVWAFKAGVPAELVAFLRFRPELLIKFDPARAADMEPFPCPRTWEFAGKTIQMGLPEDLEFEALKGAVGEGAATELAAFLKLLRSNPPNPDAIIIDPDSAPIPERPDILYAVVTALASRATEDNAARVLRYAERLHNEGQGEFAALLLKDTLRKAPGVQNTPEWTRFCLTEFGKNLLS